MDDVELVTMRGSVPGKRVSERVSSTGSSEPCEGVSERADDAASTIVVLVVELDADEEEDGVSTTEAAEALEAKASCSITIGCVRVCKWNRNFSVAKAGRFTHSLL